MKMLLILGFSFAVLTACSSGSSSSGVGQVSAPVITDPANSAYTQMTANHFYLPVVPTCTREGTSGSSYFKDSFVSSNMEFINMREYHGDSTCNSLLLYASKVFTFVSYVNINADQNTSFSLIDVQLSIVDANVLTSYNAASLFAISNWSLGNARSIINRKAQPADISPVHVSGTISKLNLRKNLNLFFIDGIQYQ